MEPIPYNGTPAEVRARLIEVLRNHPRTEIVQQEPDYLKAVCRSRIFRFPDDVEFVFDDAARQIHFRSASRLGYGDRGVNRRRMKEIRAAFEASGG
jgi:uncharacterized protein (DUF1499 family)